MPSSSPPPRTPRVAGGRLKPHSVEAFVEGVEGRLADVLARRSENPVHLGRDLWAAARHTTLAGAAKRSRTRLVWHFGQAVGAPLAGLERIAATCELIHAASLVHDDVIDQGTLRRGRPTVNVLWENITAVLSGDLMLSVGFGLLRDDPPIVMTSAIDLLRIMSAAAIEEVHARGDLQLSLARWREIAEGKTGALFGFCGSAPAHIVSDKDAAARFDKCGAHLGVAFQIADDLKDLVVSDGKDRFADIKNQNPSYPLLWAAQQDAQVESALQTAWSLNDDSPETAARIGAQIIDCGAAERAAEQLKREIELGLEALGGLRGHEHIQAVEAWAFSMLKQRTWAEAA